MSFDLEPLLISWAEFLTIHKGRRAGGVAWYVRVVRNFFLWRGDPCPTTVSRAEIERWQKALYLELGNMSNSSRSNKLAATRSFFAWLRYSGEITADPTQGVPSPRQIKALPQKFSREELTRLFAAPKADTVKGVRDLAILKTLYASGLRVSELVALDVNHLVDTGGYIRLQVLDGKGGKKRTLTLRTNPSRTLRQWLHIRAGIATEHQALFVSLKGKTTGRLSIDSCQQIMKKYSKLAGIAEAEAYCHKLRASFASDLYDSGNDKCPRCGHAIQYVGVLEVAALMGHADIKTTMGYIAISDRVLHKTAIPDRRFNEIEEGKG